MNKIQKEIIAREHNKKCDKCGSKDILYETWEHLDYVNFECKKCNYNWGDEL